MANLTFAQLENLWTTNGGSTALAPLMAAVALAESGGNPGALNPTDNGGRQSSFGLWQISTGTHTAPNPNWSDPNVNAQLAVAKEKTQGLGAWGTYTSGAAQKILSANGGAAAVFTSATSADPNAALPAPESVPSGTTADEGYLFDVHIPGTSTDIQMQNSTARKILGGLVMVGGGVITLAGVFVLVGAGKKLPGPVGAVQGALEGRREGRREEAMVTGRAQGRRRRATEEAEGRRQAANRREAEEAVSERRRQNRDAQRQEDALQRIESRRLAAASGRRSSTPGHGRERTAPRRRRLEGSGTGDF